MTSNEVWQMIADCTLKEDWIGLLCAADALSDSGDDDTAIAIRWAIGRRWFPYVCNDGDLIRFKVYLYASLSDHTTEWVTLDGVRKGWKWVSWMRGQMELNLDVLEYIG